MNSGMSRWLSILPVVSGGVRLQLRFSDEVNVCMMSASWPPNRLCISFS